MDNSSALIDRSSNTFGVKIEFVLEFLIPENSRHELKCQTVEDEIFQQLLGKTDKQYAKVREALGDAGLKVYPFYKEKTMAIGSEWSISIHPYSSIKLNIDLCKCG